MNRRAVLKGGLAVAATSHVAALAPETPITEDPRVTLKRLSWEIADLLNQLPEYATVSITASAKDRFAVHTAYTI